MTPAPRPAPARGAAPNVTPPVMALYRCLGCGEGYPLPLYERVADEVLRCGRCGAAVRPPVVVVTYAHDYGPNWTALVVENGLHYTVLDSHDPTDGRERSVTCCICRRAARPCAHARAVLSIPFGVGFNHA